MSDREVPNDVYNYPAHVVRAVMSDADLLKLAKKQVRNPAAFDDDEYYFWSAEISNNQLDSYYTRMHKTSLKNYAEEAERGISFMSGHQVMGEQALGRSLSGKFTGASGNGVARVAADFYTIRGLRTNSLPSDEFIRGVEAGIIQDVSIGFYGGTFRCTICNNDLWSWDCWHIPGVEYDILDSDGRKTGNREICTAWVENSHLSEVSAVYDGATPGAAIRKAEMEIRQANEREPEARVKADNIRLLEARYRIHLPSAPTTMIINATGDPQAVGDEVMRRLSEAAQHTRDRLEDEGMSLSENTRTVEDQETPEEEVVETPPEEIRVVDPIPETPAIEVETREPEVEDTISESNDEPEVPAADDESGEDDDMEQARSALLAAFEAAGVEPTDDPLTEAARLIKDVPRLRQLADMGSQYREDLINSTIEEGIRAKGDKFQTETMRGVLAKSSLDEIKAFRSLWETEGDEVFGDGPKVPSDNEDATPEPAKRVLPDAAFQVR